MRRALLLVAAMLVAGCGAQGGLHTENGGHRIAVVTPPSTSGKSGRPVRLPRRVTAHVELGGVPTLAWGGGPVWAAAWAGGPRALGSLIAIDPVTGKPGAARPLPPSTQPYLVVATATTLFVASSDRLMQIDATGRVTAHLAMSAPPRGLVDSLGSIWLTIDQGALLRIDPARLTVIRTLKVTGAPDAITAVTGSVYVTDDHDRALRRIEPKSGRVAATVSIAADGGAAPAGLTVYGDSIWAYEGSSVVRLQRRGERLLDRITLPDGAGAMAAGSGGIWVTGDFGVARIDPLTGSLGRPIPLPGGGRALATTGSAVWVADGHGTVLRISP
jgi:streptogramin lyase